MKKILVLLYLFYWYPINAQHAPGSVYVHTIDPQDSWNKIRDRYGEIKDLSLALNSTLLVLTKEMIDNRDALLLDNINKNILQQMVTLLEEDTKNFHNSQYAHALSLFLPNYPTSPRELYNRTAFSKKLEKEIFYLKAFAGTPAAGANGEPMNLTEGDRILLMLNGLENIFNFTLKYQEE